MKTKLRPIIDIVAHVEPLPYKENTQPKLEIHVIDEPGTCAALVPVRSSLLSRVMQKVAAVISPLSSPSKTMVESVQTKTVAVAAIDTKVRTAILDRDPFRESIITPAKARAAIAERIRTRRVNTGHQPKWSGSHYEYVYNKTGECITCFEQHAWGYMGSSTPIESSEQGTPRDELIGRNGLR